ncbi:PREDICTED: uncharacterized protein LOC108749032 [Trachymyrmex septentrionalis]|uniref:uncharacterized protein LOC108749032 n=1 Tax=Trachymyrmex septentrionalis TaxID=34720 RepID=UPI00084F6DC6|nr:PREDICTED: uncharacterized protein LOC108749032 [Trachymyrmex septentrionalis]
MKKKSDEKREKISSEKRRLVEELQAPARRNFPRKRVIVRGYFDLWQVDIVEMRPYSSFNRGYHYIRTVIDVLSKYAWAVMLKSKGGSETANAIAEINILKKHNVNHYSTYSTLKASVVERFNHTLKNDMWKMFTLDGNYKWVDELLRLVSEYNARKHRTIGMRPSDVTSAIAEKLLGTVYSAIKIAGPAKFKGGDSKGYTPNWTTEVFTIIKVQRTNPIIYLLKDYRRNSVAGAFYEHELHRATHPDVYEYTQSIRQCPHGNVSVEFGTTYRLSSYGLRAIFDSDIVYTCSLDRIHD